MSIQGIVNAGLTIQLAFIDDDRQQKRRGAFNSLDINFKLRAGFDSKGGERDEAERLRFLFVRFEVRLRAFSPNVSYFDMTASSIDKNNQYKWVSGLTTFDYQTRIRERQRTSLVRSLATRITIFPMSSRVVQSWNNYFWISGISTRVVLSWDSYFWISSSFEMLLLLLLNAFAETYSHLLQNGFVTRKRLCLP